MDCYFNLSVFIVETAITEACNEVIKCGLLTSLVKLLSTTFDIKKEVSVITRITSSLDVTVWGIFRSTGLQHFMAQGLDSNPAVPAVSWGFGAGSAWFTDRQ